MVDASFFPSSGAVNPALTIIANALRVGDHLLERLGASRAADHATPSPSVVTLPESALGAPRAPLARDPDDHALEIAES